MEFVQEILYSTPRNTSHTVQNLEEVPGDTNVQM